MLTTGRHLATTSREDVDSVAIEAGKPSKKAALSNDSDGPSVQLGAGNKMAGMYRIR